MVQIVQENFPFFRPLLCREVNQMWTAPHKTHCNQCSHLYLCLLVQNSQVCTSEIIISTSIVIYHIISHVNVGKRGPWQFLF